MDTVVTAYAAGQIVRNAEPEEGWDGFLKKSYHVGEENLQSGIPKTIILEIASQAALRLRESAMTITGAQEKTIRSSGAYRLLLKWPIDAAYAFFQAQRTAPEWKSLINLGLIVASFAVLVADIFLFSTQPKGYFRDHWKIVGLVGVLPAVVLLAVVGFLAWWRRPVTAKGNPARRFHLRAALPDRWAKALPNLSVEQGAAVFTELISGFKNPEFERSGFKVDVEQLERCRVLGGEGEIVVLGRWRIRSRRESNFLRLQWQ